jgi:hypothetical protein
MRRRGYKSAENIEKTQRDRKINAPKRLPRKRPRALTNPLPDDRNRSWIRHLFKNSQHASEQSESLLFTRLPPEIRDLIWTEVLGGHLLHLVHVFKRLRAVNCTETFGPDLETRRHGCWGLTNEVMNKAGFYLRPQLGHTAKPINLLPLL